MATHSSVLAWRIPGTGESGGLPSMGSHRVGHDGSDLAAAAAAEQLNNHQQNKKNSETMLAACIRKCYKTRISEQLLNIKNLQRKMAK